MIGQTISHYKILEKLGEGGMGEVYKARDTKLDRFVALKFLPSKLITSDEDKARFIQEAKAASAMNHPNVCTIYSIGEYNNPSSAQGVSTDSQSFISMEYVEGKTLKDKKDNLSEKQILEVGIQVAEGMAAAHEKGIVHRDIKPENIMIRKDGIAQIMDFGLAKLYTSGNISRLTKAGTTMGTMGYMSPEQIQGLDVDHRTDIFSLGVVLYELLAGESPFKGMHETAIMYEIVNVEPQPISTIKEGIDPELDRIILECLEKDKDERCQSAKELAKDLRKVKKSAGQRKSRVYNVDKAALSDEGGGSQISKSSGSVLVEVFNHRFDLGKLFRLKYIPWVLFVLTLAFVIYSQLSKTKSNFTTFSKFELLTEQSGEELFPDISPDGNYITYTKSADGFQHIFLQRIGGGNAIDLTRDSRVNNYQSSFSPDGQLLVFRSERDGGGLFLMGSTGESVRRLTKFGYNPAWSPDSKKIVFAAEMVEHPYLRIITSSLWIAEIGTGKTEKLYDRDAVQPNWSPDGNWIAFWGLPTGTGERAIWIIKASGGKPFKITNDKYINWSPFWSADGRYLYFSSNRGGSMNLWKVKIDGGSGEISSDFETVITPSLSSIMAKTSQDGQKLIYVAQDQRANIYRINFDPINEKVIGIPEAVTEGSKQFNSPSVSPDNKYIAAQSSGSQEDIYVINLNESGFLKLTNDIYKDRGPKWSPDGKSLLFYSDRSGKYQIWEIDVDGSNLRKLTDLPGYNPIWFPDGKKIAFFDNNQINYIVNLDSTKGQKPTTLPEYIEKDQSFNVISVSADETLIAGDKMDNNGGNHIGLAIYYVTKQSYTSITNTGYGPIWLNDTKRILYADSSKFYILNTITGNRKLIYDLKLIIPDGSYFTISPDNKWIYYIKQEKESDIWMGYLK